MKENIELNKVREFGDIMSDTFVVLRQNIKPLLSSYFVLCGMFIAAGTLATIVVSTQPAEETSIFSFWGIFNYIFQITDYTTVILTTVSYLAIYKQKENQPPQVIEVWEYFKYYFFRVLGTQVVLVIALAIGTMLCIIPGVYLFPVFSLVVPIMIIENTNAEYAIRKAFKIIKQNWWFAFGGLLLMGIIAGVTLLVILIPLAIIYGGSQWLTGHYLSSSFNVIASVIIHTAQVLWLLPITATTLLYYSLTEHIESGSLVKRIQMFGKNNPSHDKLGSDQFPSEQY